MTSTANLAPPALTETTFPLPVLETLSTNMTARGVDSVVCHTPVAHGSLQVGFRGRPDTFNAVEVSPADNGLHIKIATPMAVEGPILDRSGLTPRVARHTTPEIAKVDLARDANSSMWLAIATNSDGEVVTLTDYDRLTLSRTFAKVGDIALRKLNKK